MCVYINRQQNLKKIEENKKAWLYFFSSILLGFVNLNEKKNNKIFITKILKGRIWKVERDRESE